MKPELDWSLNLFKRAAIPAASLAFLGVSTAGAVAPRSEGDSSAHVLSLNSAIDSRCDPNSYYLTSIQFPLNGKREFWGISNGQGGIPPVNNPTHAIGTGFSCEDDIFQMIFQLKSPMYQIDQSRAQLAIDNVPALDLSRNKAHFPVIIAFTSNTYFLDGGETMDINNPGDWNNRSKITSGGISGIQTDGNFTTTSLVNFNNQDCLLRKVPNALDVSKRGDYRLCPDGNNTFASGSWIKVDSPTVTATATKTSTIQLSVTPTASASPSATPEPTSTPGGIVGGRDADLGIDILGKVGMNWTGGNMQLGYAIWRFYSGREEVIAVLPANTTSFTDNSSVNGLACYSVLPFNETGLLGNSSITCTLAGTRSGFAPAGVRIGLQGNTTKVSFAQPNPNEGRALIVLKTPLEVIPAAPGSTTLTHDTLVPTCYSVVSTGLAGILGNSDISCTLPGTSSLQDQRVRNTRR